MEHYKKAEARRTRLTLTTAEAQFSMNVARAHRIITQTLSSHIVPENWYKIEFETHQTSNVQHGGVTYVEGILYVMIENEGDTTDEVEDTVSKPES